MSYNCLSRYNNIISWCANIALIVLRMVSVIWAYKYAEFASMAWQRSNRNVFSRILFVLWYLFGEDGLAYACNTNWLCTGTGWSWIEFSSCLLPLATEGQKMKSIRLWIVSACVFVSVLVLVMISPHCEAKKKLMAPRDQLFIVFELSFQFVYGFVDSKKNIRAASKRTTEKLSFIRLAKIRNRQNRKRVF